MSVYDLLISGGTLVHPRGRYRADVAVIDGKIACIAGDLAQAEAREHIDATGLYLLPGCIDSHMHLWETGFVADPDFKAGSLASVAGGVTTIVDHPLTLPEVLDVQVFDQKVEIGERSAYTDFALHGGVGHGNLDELHAMWEAGCTAFKIFMCESGSKVAGLASGELLAAFRTIGSLGGTAILHAENEPMLQYNRQELEKAGRKDYMAFVDWRPPEVEIEAIHRALYLLKGTGARAVFLHTTVPEGVELVRRARLEGLDVWVETCPHNLYLTTEHLRARGPWVTFSPPVRDPKRAEQLWRQLAAGLIVSMGSDHGPVDCRLKEMGEEDIWQGQFGIPGAETMVPLMLNAVVQGKIPLERLAAILAENPARLYGIYPKKGAIQVGSDGDFTIVDLSQTYQFAARQMHTSCGWIPYEGWEVTGKVVFTILRGTVVMHNGQILGKPGLGKFVKRTADPGPFMPA